MKISTFSHSRSGFSILMALGTIGVLLIIVVGLASVYIRELKLSRTSYDDIVASAGAEGVFEYGMLKIRNHRDGFADSMTSDDPDGRMFALTSDRSKGMKVSYEIRANSTDASFTLAPNDHLIVPLFVGIDNLIPNSPTSKEPNHSSVTQKSTNVQLNGLEPIGEDKIGWTIVAIDGAQSIGLTGNGNIDTNTKGALRHQDAQCYDNDGNSQPCTGGVPPPAEVLSYFWDEEKKVSDFIPAYSDSYFMAYNSGSSVQNIHITSTTPFALPEMVIEASAQKNDSLQVYRFTEDKSRYYDAIKYGVYNDESATP